MTAHAFVTELGAAIGQAQILTKPNDMVPFNTGIRVGSGQCAAVVKPKTLWQIWQTLALCVKHDLIVIMQAANTGLNGGSTPYGEDYDRDIVVISTLAITDIHLVNNGEMALALAGASLYQLEEMLKPLNRGPHSVIGSSCIGASIVGGVCNNSGGNLVNRGPSYTELALYAQIDANGELRLVNHLGIDLGGESDDDIETILNNLQQGQFSRELQVSEATMASDREYQQRVRDTSADTPARFNADKRRLHEASGCSGKLAVFAVLVDTFANPVQEQVFYVGTNQSEVLTQIRKHILEHFDELPEMGEYMHRSFFDGNDLYGKDTFLAIKHFGTPALPSLLQWRNRVNRWLTRLPGLPAFPIDHLLQLLVKLWPDHLPERMREFRDQYEHHLMLSTHDGSIAETKALLETLSQNSDDLGWFSCTEKEAQAAMLHRFVAGGVSTRYAHIHADQVGELLPLDIALARNDEEWHDILGEDIIEQMDQVYVLSHFFCMVFHIDMIAKKDADLPALKQTILQRLSDRGAKYPAEHAVGHLYEAEPDLQAHYKCCDPTNSFNAGVGKMSKHKHYK